jgi:rod shape-determining protein MreC
MRVLKEYWSSRLHSNDELIQAGRDLARVNSSYEFAVQQNTELQASISRFESLLRLPSFPAYRYEHARVARRDFSGWWQRIVIRKGRNYGIPVDAPVIFTGGVVGKVAVVHATTAEVDLITSPNVRLAGVVEGDTRPIAFQGGVNRTLAPPFGVVESMPLDIIVTPSSPKRLVTGGFGGVFPPGLTLGYITRTEKGSDGMFQSGEVKLDDRLGSLTEVTVLVPVETGKP